MPAKSVAQRKLIALAEHHPEEVSAKNKSILSMKHSDMHDFAATSEKHLPYKLARDARKKQGD